ncbi:hypothetical protein HPB51_011300 [Rhipicephalus microplus]|uniref:Uncharacterized protein n=1 Tax=Rhipicephalus microplus TaxID=6941 RepID=A0A9J6DMX4_RHIMP|nr:hypothetical protein HPB51_011300 [Rhipicephalus microplus]
MLPLHRKDGMSYALGQKHNAAILGANYGSGGCTRFPPISLPRGDTPPPVTGLCSTCNCRADLNHLCWECPVYNPPRLRALATIKRGPWPSSLRTWACPEPSPPDRAIEFWRALIMFLQDPAAPPVGDRLRDSHKIQAIQAAPLSCLHDVRFLTTFASAVRKEKTASLKDKAAYGLLCACTFYAYAMSECRLLPRWGACASRRLVCSDTTDPS